MREDDQQKGQIERYFTLLESVKATCLWTQSHEFSEKVKASTLLDKHQTLTYYRAPWLRDHQSCRIR